MNQYPPLFVVFYGLNAVTATADRFGAAAKDARAKVVKVVNQKGGRVYGVKAHDGVKYLNGGRWIG